MEFTPVSRTVTIRTRSKAPLALVRIHRDGTATLVGYAYSRSAAVLARCRTERAILVAIVDGRVEVLV